MNLTRPHLRLVLFMGLATCVYLSACTSNDSQGIGIPPTEASSTAITEPSTKAPDAASAAQTLAVSPLTRVGTDAAGQPALLVHVEVLDAFGQAVKALGVLRVELTSDDGTGASRTWEVDVRDPATNALMYDDLVTRTYVLPLAGIPAELVDWAKDERGRGPEIRVRMTLEAGGVITASRRLGS